jgi:hypothetical protein
MKPVLRKAQSAIEEEFRGKRRQRGGSSGYNSFILLKPALAPG